MPELTHWESDDRVFPELYTDPEMDAARAYGYFDGLYGRSAELPENPAEVDSYIDGWHAGVAERHRMNTPAAREDAPGTTIWVPRVSQDALDAVEAARRKREAAHAEWLGRSA